MSATPTPGLLGPASPWKHLRWRVTDSGIAVILIDVAGRPVNTLWPALSQELEHALDRIENDDRIRGAVLASAKPAGFLAGADVGFVRTIRTATEGRRLSQAAQALTERLEALYRDRGKPLVAAIHGHCLGAGLELALACTLRVAAESPDTVIGIPGVQLGLLPGAGGTVRLPQIVGIGNALEMLLKGLRLGFQRALAMGLVDEVVPSALLVRLAVQRADEVAQGTHSPRPRGLARLREMAGEVSGSDFLQHLALEENPVGQRILFRKAREQLAERNPSHMPAPERALEVVRTGVQEGPEAGFAAEAEAFGELVVSPEARAMASLFLGRQATRHESGVADDSIEPRVVQKLGVVGAGFMGAAIAAVSATEANVPIRLKEVDQRGMLRAMRYLGAHLDGQHAAGRMTRPQAERLRHSVTVTTDWRGFELADVVLEAVPDILSLKHAVLREVEEAASDDTIFASVTSCISIAEIAEASTHPETVVGMHYLSPVEKMQLLEVVATEHTADWVIATCVELGKRQGKTVVVVRDGPCFYVTRILAPYLAETLRLLSEGTPSDTIEETMVAWGFPIGPLQLMDEIGIDFAAQVMGTLERAFGERHPMPPGIDALVDAGHTGRKDGRGFYVYFEGQRTETDEQVEKLVMATGSGLRVSSLEEMQQRMALGMVNEAVRCLEEGVLPSPRDGDVAACLGCGFPALRGGPFHWIDRVGAAEVVRRLDALESLFGPRFRAAELLRQCARDGRKLRED